MQVYLGVDDLALMGRLTKPFLYDAPTAPIMAEMQAAIRDAGLFDGLPLETLHLLASIRRDRDGMPTSSAIDVDASWKAARDGRQYSASFDFPLGALSARHPKGQDAALLAAALAVLREQAVRAVAQVAIEMQVPRMRVDAFVAGFPEVAVELKPRRRRRARRAEETFFLVEVEVRHEAQTPSAGLARRAQLRELLEDALEASALGAFDGGSSGEFHYEYTFRVRDAARATAVLREALVTAGVAAAQFDIDDLGPDE